ncbi:hypothetical protein [Polyangium sorediatum]|uniref:Lipoprotein n=1 Tax=Polyangium sorediatum TaxID=889274 RepID=A0ABT6NQU3_9BACT|nr:hypothetical protein [Polyangium sorediatum]MDI1430683.1 hypothetical protein [Polyangium sorediatum]
MALGLLSGCGETFQAKPPDHPKLKAATAAKAGASCELWLRMYTDDGEVDVYEDNFVFTNPVCIKYEGEPVVMPQEMRVFTTTDYRYVRRYRYCNEDKGETCTWSGRFNHGIPWTFEFSTRGFDLDPMTGVPTRGAAGKPLAEVIDRVRVVTNGVNVYAWNPGIPLKELPEQHASGGATVANDHTLIIHGGDLTMDFMPHDTDIGLYVTAKSHNEQAIAKAAEVVEQAAAPDKVRRIVDVLKKALVDPGQSGSYPYGQLSCLAHQVEFVVDKLKAPASTSEHDAYFNFQKDTTTCEIVAEKHIDRSLQNPSGEMEARIAKLADGACVLLKGQQEKSKAEENGVYDVTTDGKTKKLVRSKKWVETGELTKENHPNYRDIMAENRRFRLRPLAEGKGKIGSVPLIFDDFDCERNSLEDALQAAKRGKPSALAAVIAAASKKVLGDGATPTAMTSVLQELPTALEALVKLPKTLDDLKMALVKPEAQQRLYLTLAAQATNLDTLFPQRAANPLPDAGESQLKMSYYDPFQVYAFGAWNGVPFPIKDDTVSSEIKLDNAIPIIDVVGLRFQWRCSGFWNRFADARIGLGFLGLRDTVKNADGIQQYTPFHFGAQLSVAIANLRVGAGYMLHEPWDERNLRLIVGLDLAQLVTGKSLEAFSTGFDNDY